MMPRLRGMLIGPNDRKIGPLCFIVMKTDDGGVGFSFGVGCSSSVIKLKLDTCQIWMVFFCVILKFC